MCLPEKLVCLPGFDRPLEEPLKYNVMFKERISNQIKAAHPNIVSVLHVLDLFPRVGDPSVHSFVKETIRE